MNFSNFSDVSRQNTINALANALRVTHAWRDDLLIIESRHGISIDEASDRLWVDVMHPSVSDTWIATIVPARGAHPDVVAAALSYRARHYSRSLVRELEAA